MKNPMTLAILYTYDPLDRLSTLESVSPPKTRRFYKNDRFVNECQGARALRIVESDNALLAERLHDGDLRRWRPLMTDHQRSVLHTHEGQTAYTPYGHRPESTLQNSRLGFNGQLTDTLTGHYPLGNGRRFYNPVLMRFNSADRLSPFDEGGLNTYAYCGADPINRKDDSGQMWQSAIWLGVALADVAGSYIAPIALRKIPNTSKAVKKIPGISNPSFGKISKKVTWAVGALGATTFATSSVLEFTDPESGLFDPLLILMGTAAGVGFFSGMGSVLHKISLTPIKSPTNALRLNVIEPSAPDLASVHIRQATDLRPRRRNSV